MTAAGTSAGSANSSAVGSERPVRPGDLANGMISADAHFAIASTLTNPAGTAEQSGGSGVPARA